MAPMAQMMMARVAGKHMARIIGYAAVPIMLGPILGPVIAGTILQHASWRWLFLVNLPVGVLATVLAILFLPNDREETKQRDLDLVGLAPSHASLSSAFAEAFVLLGLLHALLFAASLRLPLSIDKTTDVSSAEEASMILEMTE